MTQERSVDFCPVTNVSWAARAEAKRGDCKGENVYHCLADYEGRKWERCVEKSLVKEGHCPIFTYRGFIDWKPCNISTSTCPNRHYFSNEVYNYPNCFDSNSLHEQTSRNQNKVDACRDVAAITIVLFGLILITAMICIWKKHMDSNKQEDEESSRLLSDKTSDKIVKEEIVDTGKKLLEREDVRSIIVVGKFGNSVSSTSRRISKIFKESVNWNSLEYRYTDIPSSVAENTIMFIYGWFGFWNDDLCSVNKAKTACQSLIQILNETRNVKFILGMRSDLNRKYHHELEVDDKTSLVEYEINLDSGGDVHKDDEYCRFFNDQIKKPCENRECTCKRLEYKMLRKGGDKDLGMPLKIRIIEQYHDLIPSYVHHWDMLRAMRDHFTTLEKDKKRRKVYEWIVYICLMGEFTSGSFDTDLVKEMRFTIDESSFKLTFDDNDSELCKYIRMRNSDRQNNVLPENARYVFWHPFIYICAFHFLFHKNPEFVMNHCNLDAISQLVRPKRFKTSYFEVTANDHLVILLNRRIRSLKKEEVLKYANHPLVKRGLQIVHLEAITEPITVELGLEN